ncbi:ATP-binding protein [Croceimicrobium sp.]|uniref:sensor histidine kinase n=1 Tax=Croceimicrobium sp. TaxID=2828340 RepID=UPI003BA8590F
MKVNLFFLRLLFLLFSLSLQAQLTVEKSVDSLNDLYAKGLYEELIYFGQSSLAEWQPEDTLDKAYGRTLLNLGKAYGQLEVYSEALHYHRRALAVYKQISDSLGVAHAYTYLASVYYSTEDSADAFENLRWARSYYPDSVSHTEEMRYAYILGLLYKKFDTPERGLELIDSLIPHLRTNTYLYAQVNVASIDIMDSMEFLVRYPDILLHIERSKFSVVYRIKALEEVLMRANEIGRKDIIVRYMPKLERLMSDGGRNVSVTQKARFYMLKAEALAYQKNYVAAFAMMKEYTKHLAQMDSIRGASDLKKLETQVRLKDSELNAQELELALQDSKRQTHILIVIIVLAGIIIFLIYRINRNTRERNKAIAEVASTRGRMLSILSHDIRTPLSQLIGTLEAFEEGDLNMADLKEMLGPIKSAAESTNKLLDNTVAWINVNRADFKLNPISFDVQAFYEDIWTHFAGVARNKEVSLKLDIQLKNLHADRFLVQTTLFNLISNALKFSEQGGCLILKSYQRKDRKVLEVSDNGRGISEANLEIIRWEMRISTQGTHRESGGGLGLTIVRDACHKLDADFEIDSIEGQGTNCRIVF